MTQNTEKLLMCLAELNCTVGKTEEGAILITPSVKREQEEAKEEPKFKDGDFVSYTDDDGDKFIFIYNKINDHGYISAYCQFIDGIISIFGIGKNCFRVDHISRMRLADESENKVLINALHKNRKIWNPETRTIKEDRNPHIDDKCVFLDNDSEGGLLFVTVGTLAHKEVSKSKGDVFYCQGNAMPFDYCLRFDDFDFETMQPKEL